MRNPSGVGSEEPPEFIRGSGQLSMSNSLTAEQAIFADSRWLRERYPRNLSVSEVSPQPSGCVDYLFSPTSQVARNYLLPSTPLLAIFHELILLCCPLGDDLIDETVFKCLFGSQVIVTVGISSDLLKILARMLC